MARRVRYVRVGIGIEKNRQQRIRIRISASLGSGKSQKGMSVRPSRIITIAILPHKRWPPTQPDPFRSVRLKWLRINW